MAKSDVGSASNKANSYPPWAPRIWTGLRPRDHWRLLAENKFSIHPTRYPMAGLISLWSLFNSGLSFVQRLMLQGLIEQTEIDQPPIFIIGHWRSGTTLLHELMSLDENFAYANNFDTFVPHHFLISEPIVKPFLKLLLPKKRPMDNMSVYPESPQEDEFALMILGAASQYRRMGFPHNHNDYFRYLDSQNLESHQVEQLRMRMLYFFKALTYKYKRRLVLKSPPHTGRIRSLAQWFPGAKFIHISRHPYDVVPSTLRLWKIADGVHAYQKPRYTDEELMDYVRQCKDVMYAAYFRDREILSKEQLVEVRFDELTSDPVNTIGKIYDQLGIAGRDQVQDAVAENFAARKGHKKNVHKIDTFVKRIDAEWGDYMQRFGYQACERSDEKTCVA